MAYNVRMSIEGLQKLQEAHIQVVKALHPAGPLGGAVKGAAIAAHAYAVKITKVDTGTLKSAHRVTPFSLHFLRGKRALIKMKVDIAAVANPRSGQMAYIYGTYVHEMDHDHAFYKRTVEEAGRRIVTGAGHEFYKALPQG